MNIHDEYVGKLERLSTCINKNNMKNNNLTVLIHKEEGVVHVHVIIEGQHLLFLPSLMVRQQATCWTKSVFVWANVGHTYGAFPLQRGARFKRAVTSAARFWLRFHLA